MFSRAETEIHRERGSIAPWKVFARPESSCARNDFFLHYNQNLSGESPDCLEMFQCYGKRVWIVWKVSGLSGKFPDCLESFRIDWNCLEGFQIVWKLSGLSGNFTNCLERLRIVWKVSGLSGKFPDCLESFQIVWKVSGSFEKFPDCLET